MFRVFVMIFYFLLAVLYLKYPSYVRLLNILFYENQVTFLLRIESVKLCGGIKCTVEFFDS